MIERETRDLAMASLAIRATEAAPKAIVGYAAMFESLSEDLGGFKEKIARGAFTGSIAKEHILALWQHRSEMPLGNSTSGTLRLVEDNNGLDVDISPPDTSWGRDSLVAIERGDVKHFSFGFYTLRDSWDWTDPAMPIRTLLEVRLVEVSPVTFPAYHATTANVREALAKRERQPKVEALERERLLARLNLMAIEFNN